ncbi:prepilin peptidase [Anaerobacillus sp. HL2]|nr:prepilin peptidase [Anaerobacillus sp. HL2]
MVFQLVVGFFSRFSNLIYPFLFRGMGAGDVKLLAVIGALKGTSFVFTTAIYMAIVGAIIALLIMLFHKDQAKKDFLLYLWKENRTINA